MLCMLTACSHKAGGFLFEVTIAYFVIVSLQIYFATGATV